MTAAAIKATWATYKPVPTRNVLQLTLEVPLEQQADVFEKLGYPVPGTEKWVGVALLTLPTTDKPAVPQQEPSAGVGKRFTDMSRAQQAGILCADKVFQNYLGKHHEGDTIQAVYELCGIASRRELDMDEGKASKWDALVTDYRLDNGLMAEVRG